MLVTRWGSVHLLDVAGGGAEQSVRELWGSDAFSRYGIPVRRGDHLYGFQRRFLTCVDLDTGEVVWRSRPPGGQGLIGIGDHLVVLADDGELVTVAATPEGYRETGRLGLFDRRRVLTPPSFAGDRLYVRDLGEMVAVDVRAATVAPTMVAGTSLEGGGALAGLLGQIAGGSPEESSAALARIEQDYGSMPVVEDGRAHFLYRCSLKLRRGRLLAAQARRCGNLPLRQQEAPAQLPQRVRVSVQHAQSDGRRARSGCDPGR